MAESADEITLAKQCGLSCVELRVDLLLSGGNTVAAVIAMVTQARQSDLAVLVTIRHPCLLYTSPSPRDATLSRMPSSA